MIPITGLGMVTFEATVDAEKSNGGMAVLELMQRHFPETKLPPVLPPKENTKRRRGGR